MRPEPEWRPVVSWKLLLWGLLAWTLGLMGLARWLSL